MTKEQIRDVLDDPSLEYLSDGAYWGVVHERLNLEYGDVFDYIAEDPVFYGYSQAADTKEFNKTTEENG